MTEPSAEDTVGIVGAGAFGTALAQVVAERSGGVGVGLLLHDEPDRLEAAQVAPGVRKIGDLAELGRRARLIVLAVSSTRVVATARALGDALDGRHLLVHAIGAFVPGSQRRVSELLREETAVKRIGAIAGPALAKDLAARRPCALVVASPFDEVIAATRRALAAPPTLRVYSSRDLAGLELASAISGALTMAVGLADGLGIGAGPRALLITRCVGEAARLGLAAGARERTFHGLAGLGNLLVRSSSESSVRSDDYQLGFQLGLGVAPGSRSARGDTEGTRAAAAACALAQRLHVRAPILEAIHAVAHQGIPVDVVAARLTESPAEEE